MSAFMYLYPANLPAGSMPKQKVYLIAGKSPSQMEMMKVQLFQSTARWVHLFLGCPPKKRKKISDFKLCGRFSGAMLA